MSADSAGCQLMRVALHGIPRVASCCRQVQPLGHGFQCPAREGVAELLVMLAQTAQQPRVSGQLLLEYFLTGIGTEVQLGIGMCGERLQHLLHAGVAVSGRFIVTDERQQCAAFLVARPVCVRALEHLRHLVVGFQ